MIGNDRSQMTACLGGGCPGPVPSFVVLNAERYNSKFEAFVGGSRRPNLWFRRKRAKKSYVGIFGAFD